ncbi:MAG: glycosyltransferase family 2 protein [Lachnospiraceae bacterium]|nr:glycosyltransferase family 2 protein [Lachnospiraceae bacterium]
MKIIYSKLSDQRDAKFAIRTNILQDGDGNKFIEKVPMSNAGVDHVRALKKWESALSDQYKGGDYVPNAFVDTDAPYGYLAFVEGETLEEELDRLLERGKKAEVCEKLLSFIADVRSMHASVTFTPSLGFLQVFCAGAGDIVPSLLAFGQERPDFLNSGMVTDIDLIPANVILSRRKKTVIDYEWTFDFPIPVDFVVYRTIHYYVEGDVKRHELREENLYERVGLTKEMCDTFAHMEENFQNYMRGSFEDSAAQASLGTVGIEVFTGRIGGKEIDPKSRQVYSVVPKEGVVTLTIPVSRFVKNLRIDPGDDACTVTLLSVKAVTDAPRSDTRLSVKRKFASSYEPKVTASVNTVRENVFFFDREDPQLFIEELEHGTTEITISFVLDKMQYPSSMRAVGEKLLYGYHDGRDYDTLEEHYLTAMSIIKDRENALYVLHKKAAEDAAKLDGIYRSFFYKLTKPFRMIKEAGALKKEAARGDKSAHIKDLLDRMITEGDRRAQSAEKIGDEKFSVLVPVYNTPELLLRQMIESVLCQTYEAWELCIVDGSDGDHAYVGKICKMYAKMDGRVRYERLSENLGIAENTNAALRMATGSHIALFDHDDMLHPSALYTVAKTIEETGAEFLYTDEAVFSHENMNDVTYHLKPDFAPDFLRSENYICHLSVFAKSLQEKVGEFRKECEGSQDYDMTLRLTEEANRVEHIPEVLYFWRAHEGSVAQDISAKTYTIDSAHTALSDHLKRVGLKGEVEDAAYPSTYRIRYEIKHNPKVSIIIPNKDHIEDLERCIFSILEKSTYGNYEILIVENGSEDPETFAYYEDLKAERRIRVLTWEEGFNYAAINNFAVREAKGDVVLLLNNDTEVITPEWLEEMLMFATRSDVGAVGAMLYYSDDTMQHAGVVLGIGGTAGHINKTAPKGFAGHLRRNALVSNVGAVTAACMMIEKAKYEELDGLDEEFVVAFNDVDFCCRLLDAGYLNVFTPFAELYHYESKSRGYEDTPEKLKRFEKETELLRAKDEKYILGEDPFYNPHLTKVRQDYTEDENYSVFID